MPNRTPNLSYTSLRPFGPSLHRSQQETTFVFYFDIFDTQIPFEPDQLKCLDSGQTVLPLLFPIHRGMILRTPFFALNVFFVLLHLTSAHRIEIDPGDKECFFETLQPQDRVRAVESPTQSSADLLR